jgi:hypothetical protein
MRRTTRRLGTLVLAVLVLAASGCVKQKVQGDTITYTFETWVAFAGGLGAVAAGIVGWFLSDFGTGSVWSYFSIKRTGWGLMIGAPVMATALLPAVFTNYVKVDDYHFEAKNGWWWSSEKHNLRFDQLEQIDIAQELRPSRHGTSRMYFFDCVFHSGGHERIELDPLMTEAVAEILKRAKDRGVEVIDIAGEEDDDGDPDDGNDMKTAAPAADREDSAKEERGEQGDR